MLALRRRGATPRLRSETVTHTSPTTLTNVSGAKLSSGISLQKSAAVRIINDYAAKLVLASELGAVSVQIFDHEGGITRHVVAQPLSDPTFGPGSSADMSDFSSGKVDHIDASLIRRVQFPPQRWKRLEW